MNIYRELNNLGEIGTPPSAQSEQAISMRAIDTQPEPPAAPWPHAPAPQRLLRFLCVSALLTLALTGCFAPRAEQIMAKVAPRPKPIPATATPAPTALPAPTAAPTPTAVPAAAAAPAHAVAIGTMGGEWEFDQVEVEVPAGEEIALTFKNNAKTTPHNWVLVRGGDDIALEVNTAGATAGEAAGYIPSDPRIVAHTDGLIKGGASATVTLSGLEAGTYTYVCTFPGHLDLGMKGVLVVK
jgi:azurin